DIPGGWASMLIDLRITRQTAFRLMTIPRNEVLVTHVQQLPPHWGTMYELSLIDEDTLRNLFKAGEITPITERKDVKRMRRTTAAGASIATLSHRNELAHERRLVLASLNRWTNFVWRRAVDGHLAGTELTTVMQTYADAAKRIDGDVDGLSKWHVQSVRTVNEPMWSDDDEPNEPAFNEPPGSSEGNDDEST